MMGLLRRYRRHCYKTARLIGDAQAVVKGTVVQRYVQRKTGAFSRRQLNKLIPRKGKR